MSTGSEWKRYYGIPVIEIDPRSVLGSAQFLDAEDRGLRQGGPRVLLVGHSHDIDLARLAGQLGDAGARVDAMLVDRIKSLPSLSPSEDGMLRRYDVGLCRSVDPTQAIHYHFDRTLRRSEDWQGISCWETNYVAAQAETLLWAWFDSVDVTRWVNSPWSLRSAENKLVQLRRAREAGLRIPRSLVSSSISEIIEFADELGGTEVVSKSLGTPVLDGEHGQARFKYTSRVDPRLLDDLASPYLVQERIDPHKEYRVTVVGSRTFVASLGRGEKHETDWRREAAAHQLFEHDQLSSDVVRSIHELLGALEIQIGAVDLVFDGTHEYFLEVNPAAALTWLERTLGMKLCQSVIALLLCGG